MKLRLKHYIYPEYWKQPIVHSEHVSQQSEPDAFDQDRQ